MEQGTGQDGPQDAAGVSGADENQSSEDTGGTDDARVTMPAAAVPAAAVQPAAAVPATGESRVDAALGRLADLDELAVSEHPQVYERIHAQLVGVLGELHSGSAG